MSLSRAKVADEELEYALSDLKEVHDRGLYDFVPVAARGLITMLGTIAITLGMIYDHMEDVRVIAARIDQHMEDVRVIAARIDQQK